MASYFNKFRWFFIQFLFSLFQFLIGIIVVLGSVSYIQTTYLTPVGDLFFPEWKDLLPDAIQQELKEPEPVQALEELSNSIHLYAGKDEQYLKNFFQNLRELEQKKDRIVRIVHLGDSLIWGDFVTQGVKKNFQKDFGDGGRGIVPVISKLERNILEHKNYTSESNFQWNAIRPWGREDKKLGFMGESAVPLYNGVKTFHELGEGAKPWNKIQVYLRPTLESKLPLTIDAELLLNGSQKLKNIVNFSSANCSLLEYKIEPSSKFSLELNSKGALPYIDAINVETNYGIAYTSISRTSMEMNDLQIISPEVLKCEMEHFKPHLIIFQFGVNESQNMWQTSHRPPEHFKRTLRDVLKRYKTMFPSVDLLVLSPVERIRLNSKGVYDTMPEILTIRQIQKEVSEEYKVAFYDSFSALGGKGQNSLLFKNDFIQPDRTHLTRKGGIYYADILYKNLMLHYGKFLGNEKAKQVAIKAQLKKEQNKEVNFTTKAYFYFIVMVFVVSIATYHLHFLRATFLLIVSYYFYASWNYNLLTLILLSTLIDYACGLLIAYKQSQGKRGTFFLVLSMVSNLSLLFFFKYFTFVVNLLHSIRINGDAIPLPPEQLSFPLLINGDSISLPLSNIILPVGISFYTFQTMSYTIDVWNQKIKAEANLIKFSLYVTFFPQLVAGPIVRAVDFLPFLKEKAFHFKLNYYLLSTGLFWIFWGLIKKTGADWLALNLVDRVYSNPEMYTSYNTIAAVYAYGLQIYGDFSGYTDIAIGSAMILGFKLTKNFDRPYISQSITEFWRRWHISLGTWFREYLYIPLGGNRNSMYRNLLITMILCGIWHGAGIPFFIWGIYHGGILTLERFFGYSKSAHTILGIILRKFLTLHLVLVGWIIFRSDSMQVFEGIFRSMLYNWSGSFDWSVLRVVVAGYFFCLLPFVFMKKLQWLWNRLPFAFKGVLFALLILVIYKTASSEVKPFIYFQF